MAIPESQFGRFEITDLSFTPSVIAIGESLPYSITIKNISGKSINSCYIMMRGTYTSTNAPNGKGETGYHYLYGGPSFAMSSISWGNNASKTFKGVFQFQPGYYPVSGSDYLLPLQNANLELNIATGTEFASGNNSNNDNFTNLRGTNGEYLAILSKRDNPRLSFSVERTPDDEAEKVKASILLSSDVSSNVFTGHGYSAKLYRSSSHNPATSSDTVTTLYATIDQMFSGVTDSTSAITTTLSKSYDWSFLLVIDNGYEKQSAVASIPRAFANLHLSGCSNGGACFGGFSKSTEETPMLESYYPAYFYGGIAEIGNAWTTLTLTTGTTPGDYGGGGLRCRAIGDKRIVDGSINVQPGSETIRLAKLPDGYTPNKAVFSINACSGSRVARIAIGEAGSGNAGYLCLSWVKDLLKGESYTGSSIWIQCSIEYWI